VTGLSWRLAYAGWQPGSVRADDDQPVFVSLTDFRIHRARHAPGAWRAGFGLRRSWPRLEGAIGLWLWAEPLRLRSGSVSVWRSEEDLMRFLRSPVHRAIVRAYRSRMSGTSRGWTAERLDRTAIWERAVVELTEMGEVPSPSH
jgi:heme-degrading monooxygenase HmoA